VEDFPVTVVNDIHSGDLYLFPLAFRDFDGETASCVTFQQCLKQFDFRRFAKDCVEMEFLKAGAAIAEGGWYLGLAVAQSRSDKLAVARIVLPHCRVSFF
jgi:hypothetical protein